MPGRLSRNPLKGGRGGTGGRRRPRPSQPGESSRLILRPLELVRLTQALSRLSAASAGANTRALQSTPTEKPRAHDKQRASNGAAAGTRADTDGPHSATAPAAPRATP